MSYTSDFASTLPDSLDFQNQQARKDMEAEFGVQLVAAGAWTVIADYGKELETLFFLPEDREPLAHTIGTQGKTIYELLVKMNEVYVEAAQSTAEKIIGAGQWSYMVLEDTLEDTSVESDLGFHVRFSDGQSIHAFME